MNEKKAVAQTLRAARVVCFDVDSTVITNEGIDELASLCGAGEQVAEWTRRAMCGGVTFREALSARLQIIRPSLPQLHSFLEKHPLPLTPGVSQFIELLQRQGKHVYLISGGFKQMILPLAQALGLPPDNVFANVLLFDEETGDYKGFDESQPTSESGGKARVVAMLKDLHANKDNDAVSPPSIVMIGDGVTDMEARPPADLFVGFGGNVVREKVKQGADLFVMQFAELMALYQEEL
ncbi:phosphoserine phosphatase [Balamuthia mandrillaris]